MNLTGPFHFWNMLDDANEEIGAPHIGTGCPRRRSVVPERDAASLADSPSAVVPFWTLQQRPAHLFCHPVSKY